MPGRAQLWSLVLGTLGLFVLMMITLAFYGWGLLPAWGLLPLSLATLLWAAGPTRWWERSLIGVLVLFGLTFVATPFVPFDSAVGAYVAIVAAAFAGIALVAPDRVLRQALRAGLLGVAATGLLGLWQRGRFFWAELQWSTVRETTLRVSFLVERRPELAALAAGFVQFLTNALPAVLLLITLAALVLAWQWHARIARTPLGAPLGRFRDFRFGNQWVWGLALAWGLVLAFVVWAVPKLAALKWAALNGGIVLGALYVLRGAAVVAAVASAVGMPAWMLAAGAAVAGVLVVPVFVLVPGLWTLGVFDTWLAFRQRRFSRSPAL